jgi:membrane associated rhomboid family serine protease
MVKSLLNMGIYDRDYMVDNRKTGAFICWSLATWLIILNSTLFVVQHLLLNGDYEDLFNLTKRSLFWGDWWRLFSFQFSHSDLGHFLVNMVFLFFAGRMFEPICGGKWLLLIYLLGGAIGGFLHILYTPTGLVGASGSILAILMALIFMVPEQPVTLFFSPIHLKLKVFGWLILGANLIGLFLPSSRISNLSYFGGIMAGSLLICIYRGFFNRSKALNRKGEPRKLSKIAEAAEIEISKKRQKETLYLHKKVDVILDKINQEGMQSLTPEERKVLDRSREKLSRERDDKSDKS